MAYWIDKKIADYVIEKLDKTQFKEELEGEKIPVYDIPSRDKAIIKSLKQSGMAFFPNNIPVEKVNFFGKDNLRDDWMDRIIRSGPDTVPQHLTKVLEAYDNFDARVKQWKKAGGKVVKKIEKVTNSRNDREFYKSVYVLEFPKKQIAKAVSSSSSSSSSQLPVPPVIAVPPVIPEPATVTIPVGCTVPVPSVRPSFTA
jgi:hypothetical protein